MKKNIKLAAILIFYPVAMYSQINCFCDTTKIVNYVDSSYLWDSEYIEMRIDKDTGNKYFRKTIYSKDTIRYYYQINDSLHKHGEAYAWYANGQLNYRLQYENGHVVGSNNFFGTRTELCILIQ